MIASSSKCGKYNLEQEIIEDLQEVLNRQIIDAIRKNTLDNIAITHHTDKCQYAADTVLVPMQGVKMMLTESL